MKKIIYLYFVFLMASCSSSNDVSEVNAGVSTNAVKLEIVDTIVFNYEDGVLALSDFQNKKYLAIDRTNTSVCVFDSLGGLISTFKKLGDGIGEYSRINNSCFLPSGNICITDLYNAYEYTLNGDFVNELPLFSQYHLSAVYSPIYSRVVDGDTSLIYREWFQEDWSASKDAYGGDRKHIKLYNLSKGESFKGVPHEDNSIYTNGEYFYDNASVKYTYNEKEDLIYAIRPYEPIIRVYRIEDASFVLINEFDTKPDNYNFSPEKYKFSNADNLDPEKMFLDEQLNSPYITLYSFNDFIVAEYLPPVSKLDVASTISEYNTKISGLRKRHLQFFKDDKKLCVDYELNAPFTGLFRVVSDNQILFFGSTDDGRDLRVVYNTSVSYE